MSSPVESESIQLNFCQRCGISIPQADIETGRARAAPGGYVCAGCVYQQRDDALGASAAAPMPSRAPASARDAGSRALTTIALLYVVGVTTFLLVKELNRTAPARIDLTQVAKVESMALLSRKLDGVEEQSRNALAALKSNDNQTRDDVKEVSRRLNTLTQTTTKLESRVSGDIEDLQATVLQIANRTGLLKEDVATVLTELRGIGDRVAAGGGGPGPVVDGDGPKKDGPPAKPPVSDEEKARSLAVRDYIAKLGDRKLGEKTNQKRYNAAVQLGDLKDAQAVPALIDALENDPYDLVRRAAAWSLSMFGKQAVPAIPALIGQIGGKEEYVGYMCERALGEITKACTGTAVGFGFDPTMKSSARRKVQKKWEEWWAKNRGTIEG